MRIDLESPVTCVDGPFGELADIVIDPNSRRVTHLVVEPRGEHPRARLTAISHAHVEESTSGVVLDYALAEVEELKPLHRMDFVPLGDRPAEASDSDIGIEDDLLVPPDPALNTGTLGVAGPLGIDPHITISYDLVPKGTVELRRASEVRSSDGHHLGDVVAVILDDHDEIKELVLEHGHLWGKREILIPGVAIDHIASDEVVLTLTKDQATR